MRNVTSKMEKALKGCNPCKSGNTETDGQSLWLHGNRIAYRDRLGFQWFSLAGWPTPTTRERLKAIGAYVYQMKGCQYCGEQPIDENRWYRFDMAMDCEKFSDVLALTVEETETPTG